MDRTVIRNFAISARNILIDSIKEKALSMGVTENGVSHYYGHLSQKEATARQHFVDEIMSKSQENYSTAFNQVVEDIAYLWFTRIVALRYMDINSILPFDFSVFPDEENSDIALLYKYKDSIIALTKDDNSLIEKYKEGNKDDDLYTLLFIRLNDYLTGEMRVFPHKLLDYQKALLSLSLKEGGVIDRLSKIPVDNFTTGVEIMGWFHQYYNTDVFNKLYDGDMSKKKITSEFLPVATQLYTPDWVVKYMVENTLGRIWIDHLIGNAECEKAEIFKKDLDYYIPDESEHSEELKAIRERRKLLKLSEIKFIDPCMGSGHILVYALELLVKMYTLEGYSKKQAVTEILMNNIYGLDIDKRACNLSYFALMMKSQEYDSDILNNNLDLNLCYIRESNPLFDYPEIIDFFCGNSERLREETEYLLNVFYDAKEFGSILNMRKVDYKILENQLEKIKNYTPENDRDNVLKNLVLHHFPNLIKQSKIMTDHYDAVVTNPPYLSNSRMSQKLSEYVNREYSIAKNDLATVFIQKAVGVLSKEDALISMITTVSWMYIKSFEKFRKYLVHSFQFNSIVDFGTELFEGKIGHLPVVTWVNRKNLPFEKMCGVRLAKYNYGKRREKHQQFFNTENHYYVHQLDFAKISGEPIAYWLGENFLKAFEQGRTLGELTIARNGMKTGDNNRFLRLWWEVDFDKINFSAKDVYHAYRSEKVYFPYNKGGEYRKWYGNDDYVIDWHNNGEIVMGKAKAEGRNTQDYNSELKFLPLVTWSLITVKPAFRFKKHALSDIAGMSFYVGEDKLYYYLGFCNCVIAREMIKLLAPTMNCQIGDIAKLPILHSNSYEEEINSLVKENIAISKEDWDSFETSWNFTTHPFIKYRELSDSKIEEAYFKWEEEALNRFERLKHNEERLNQIFLDIYGIDDTFDYTVEDKDITLRKGDKKRDVKSFLSYAVGCIFGRYSLGENGVVSAGTFNNSDYKEFFPVSDNCVVVTDNDDYERDIVYYVKEFIKTAFGEKYFEENWIFISSALEEKGKTPDEKIRNYFFSTFYKEHLSAYSVGVSGKRPIYFMLNSGKKNAFKALSYVHRWHYTTLGDIRRYHINSMISYYKDRIYDLDSKMDSTNDSYPVMMKFRDILLSRYDEIQSYDKTLDRLQGVDIDLSYGIKYNHRKIQTTVEGDVLKIFEKI